MSLLKANSVQIGQSATAFQNFTLAVPSSPDGTIKLARGNSGATTQDILTITSGGVVSFPNNPSAYSPNPFFFFKSANQTVTADTSTRCTFDSTLFNINSKISLASNVFTPTLAGYYSIQGQIFCPSGGSGYPTAIALYKNGSATNGIHGYMGSTGANTGIASSAFVEGILYFNGTTDTFELWGRSSHTVWSASSGTATNAIQSVTYATYIQGMYLGS